MRTSIIALLLCSSVFSASSYGQSAAANPQTDQSSPSPTLIRNFSGLVALLDRDSVAHQTNAADKLVVIPTEKNSVDSVCVIRWAADAGFVHFIHQIPIKLPKEKLSDVEIAMVRLNHGIPYPGLGINHDTLAMYFRMSVPFQPQGGLTDAQVRTYFSHTLSESEKWRPLLAKVIDGTAPATRIVEYFNSKQSDSTESATATSSMFPPKELRSEIGGSKWQIKFDSDKKVSVIRDGVVAVNSTYATRENQIRFSDISGPLATKEPGVYQWTLSGNEVSFVKIKDEAGGRAGLLTSSKWTVAQ